MTVFLVMEYLENGDLEKYITPELSESDAKSITRQLLEGLKVLHGMDWMHRDLKPQNIFVVEPGPKWWVKVGDFGISRRLHHDQKGTHTVIGTPDYLAPEISMPDAFSIDDSDDDDDDKEYSLRPTAAVDVWSLGCVLHRLFVNRLPFSSHKALKTYCKGKSQLGLESDFKQQVSEEGIEVLQGMLKAQPEARVTVAGVLSNRWFDNQEASDGNITPATDEVSSTGSSNNLPDNGARTAVNPAAGDLGSKGGSHALTELNPSSTSQFVLKQENAVDRKRTDGGRAHFMQHSYVNERSAVNEERTFDIPAASLPLSRPTDSPNEGLDTVYRSRTTTTIPSLPSLPTCFNKQVETTISINLSKAYQEPSLPTSSPAMMFDEPLNRKERGPEHQSVVKIPIQAINSEIRGTTVSPEKSDRAAKMIKPKRNLQQAWGLKERSLREQKYGGTSREGRLQSWKLRHELPMGSALAQPLGIPRISTTLSMKHHIMPLDLGLRSNPVIYTGPIGTNTGSNGESAHTEPLSRSKRNKTCPVHAQQDILSQRFFNPSLFDPQQRVHSNDTIFPEALTFLQQVEAHCTNQPYVYGEFLQILSELQSQNITIPKFIRSASQLFKAYPKLTQGLMTFLPPGYKIDLNGFIARDPRIEDAFVYLDLLEAASVDQPDMYNKFLDIMAEFKRQAIDTPETIFRILRLLRDYPNLIQRFNVFLPLGHRVDYHGSNKYSVITPNGITRIKDCYADTQKGAENQWELDQAVMRKPIKAML